MITRIYGSTAGYIGQIFLIYKANWNLRPLCLMSIQKSRSKIVGPRSKNVSSFRRYELQATFKLFLTLQPTGRGGGGRGLAQSIRLFTIALKRLILAHPNLVTFSFYLLVIFLQNISAKSTHQGSFCSSFWKQTPWNIEHMNFFVSPKSRGNTEGEGV